MNIKTKLLILLLIVILLFFIIRTIIYNNYINRLSKVQEDFSNSNLKSEEKSAIELNANTPNNLLNILSNPVLIYSTILGELFIFTNESIFVIVDKEIKTINLQDFFDEKYNITNHNNNFTGGYFNYKNNSLIIFQNDLVVCYSLKEKTQLFTESKQTFFKGSNIKNAFVFFDKLICFDEKNNIKLLNLNTMEILEDDKTNDIFGKVPNKFSNCFINFLDIQKGIPIGTPTFIDNGDIYSLDLSDNKLYGPRRIEDGIINNVNCTKISKSKENFNISESGMYRMYAFGAGMENGGEGGLIFNDIYLKNSDKISLFCGEPGRRLPVKTSTGNNLSKVYSIKLPFNGSCSGSGATVLKVNKDIKLISGGGGGWSSELVDPPSFCNSQKYTLNNLEKTKIKKIVPIKKLIITSGLSRNNYRFRINVSKFNLDVFNQENTKIDVNQTPLKEDALDDKTYIYETDWCNVGDIAQVEFSFDKPVSDYRIKLEYNIESTDKSEYPNSKVIIIDEQYRTYVIDNFNNTFNYKYLTGETIKKFTNPNPKNSIENESYITDGYSIKTDINTLNQSFKEFTEYEEHINSLEKENRYILLKGGFGGGGHCYSDRKSHIIISSGGGGYEGGKTKVSDLNDEYCGGQGGTSYIEKLNFKGDWYETCEDAFIENLNNGPGFLIIQKINKRPKQNEYKIRTLVEEANNNNNNDSDRFNTLNFFNKNVEKFFDKNSNELNRQRVITPLNSMVNSSRFSLKTGNKIIKKKTMLLKVDVTNSNHFDNVCIIVKSQKETFSLMVIGWNKTDFSRYLIDLDTNEYQEDDVSQLNHGLEQLKPKELETYLKLITENNIYRHTNVVNSSEDLKTGFNYKLTSLKQFVKYSKVNLVNEVVQIKPEYDKLFILVCFDNEKENSVNYVLNKFNSKTDDIKDVKKRSQLYL
jgi:hypothetical protein